MTTQQALSPNDFSAADFPIKQDDVGEELFAARLNYRRLTRTSIIFLLFTVMIMAGALTILATRPIKRVYIKIDSFGRATPVKYSGMEHYTPSAVEAKTYLNDWVRFRYERRRDSVLQTFPKNYMFLESGYGIKTREQDSRNNVAAMVAAGRDKENELAILSTNLTSFREQAWGGSTVAAGSAEIVIQKRFRKEGEVSTQTWVIAVRFYLNPDQVDVQSEDNPEYQNINPLGLTIVEFIANHSNADAGAVAQ